MKIALSLALWLVLLTRAVGAQVETVPGAWSPDHRKLADAIGTVGVSAQIGADTFASWRSANRRSAFLHQGCRLGLAFGVSELLKRAIPEDRPDGSDRQSFPSMHTALASASAGWQWSAGVSLGAFVGASRVGANKHHWGDVLAGAGLGALAQWVCR